MRGAALRPRVLSGRSISFCCGSSQADMPGVHAVEIENVGAEAHLGIVAGREKANAEYAEIRRIEDVAGRNRDVAAPSLGPRARQNLGVADLRLQEIAVRSHRPGVVG